ncbi:MAG: DNA-3-methyladenine glycosylase [Methanocella sp.]
MHTITQATYEHILPRGFYLRPTLTVARNLLGKTLVRMHPDYGRLAARIVEIEGYLGFDDRASHARFGETEANRTEFEGAGHAYVFQVFGVYYCLDIVTGPVGVPTVVFIRAGEPVEGIEAMEKLRGGRVRRARDLTSGPSKLCQALGITRALDGQDVCIEGPLYVTNGQPQDFDIVQTTRVGVSYAGEDKDKPWRFYIKDNPYVSKR